jgi:hypothetical protein
MEHTKKLVALASGFEGVKIACDQFMKVLDEGGKLNDLSAQTGIATEKLVLLQRAFQNNGMEADDVGKVVNKMQKAISDAGESGSEAADKLHKLGLFAVDLKAMSPEDQLGAFAKALNEIQDPADRSAAAMDIFGKSGGRMLSLFSNMPAEIKAAGEEVGTYAKIMGDKAQEFDVLGDKIQNSLGHKVVEFFAGALSNLSGGFVGLADAVSKFDAAAVGAKLTENLSEPFKALATAVTSGQFLKALEMAYDIVQLQAMKMGNEMYRALNAAFTMIGVFAAETFSSTGPIFSSLMNRVAEAGNFIIHTFTEAFLVAGSKAHAWLNTAMAALKMDIPGVLAGMAELALVHDQFSAGTAKAATSWSDIISHTLDVGKNIYKTTDGIFDTNRQLEKMSDLSKEISGMWQHSDELVDRMVNNISKFNGMNPMAGFTGPAPEDPKSPMQEFRDQFQGTGLGPIDDGRSGSTEKVKAEKTATISIPAVATIPSSFLGSNPYDQSVKSAQAAGDYLSYLSAIQAQSAYNAARQEELNYQSGLAKAAQDYTGSSQTSFADLFASIKDKYGDMGYNRADAADLANKELQDYIQKNPGPAAKNAGGAGGAGASAPQKSPEATLMDKIYALLEKHVPKIDDKLPLMALS